MKTFLDLGGNALKKMINPIFATNMLVGDLFKIVSYETGSWLFVMVLGVEYVPDRGAALVHYLSKFGFGKACTSSEQDMRVYGWERI